jgi:hypothetical protein
MPGLRRCASGGVWASRCLGTAEPLSASARSARLATARSTTVPSPTRTPLSNHRLYSLCSRPPAQPRLLFLPSCGSSARFLPSSSSLWPSRLPLLLLVVPADRRARTRTPTRRSVSACHRRLARAGARCVGQRTNVVQPAARTSDGGSGKLDALLVECLAMERGILRRTALRHARQPRDVAKLLAGSWSRCANAMFRFPTSKRSYCCLSCSVCNLPHSCFLPALYGEAGMKMVSCHTREG